MTGPTGIWWRTWPRWRRLPPDPAQRLALDAIFAQKDGRSAAFEVAVISSRQNIKTAIFKMAALGWLFITGERLVVWSAHEFPTAAEAFRDLDDLVTGCDYLRRQVRNIYRGNGDESIELLSGARLIFKTRTKGGGRGLSGRKVILDEGFALRPMHMGALLPTLSAQPDPQVLYGSVRLGWRTVGRAAGGAGPWPAGHGSASGVDRVLRAAAGGGVRGGGWLHACSGDAGVRV